MEPKEIKRTCLEIDDLINNSKRGLIYRDYETFLKMFGMLTRRNLKVFEKVNSQLKKLNVTFWVGKEQIKSILDFKRGEKITFRLKESIKEEGKFVNEGSKKVEYNYAGTIKISQEESGINLYRHQEDAIENLQNKIIRTNKIPFAGLLVLPTGGGKTLTAAYWLAKNYLAKDKKILWIAHRHELLEQAKATFHKKLAFKDIFQKKTSFNYRIISGIHDGLSISNLQMILLFRVKIA